MQGAARCRLSADLRPRRQFPGAGRPRGIAKAIVLIGSHIGENVFTSQVTDFVDGLPSGAKLIVVDPRFSTAASKADSVAADKARNRYRATARLDQRPHLRKTSTTRNTSINTPPE